MRAIGVTEFGGPEALHLLDVPAPVPGPGEVRIRVKAASVNPADRNTRTGFWVEPPDQPPYVPGMEAAGVLDAIGDGTRTDLRVGARVMAIVTPYGDRGAYAEQVVVPVESVVCTPSTATDIEAATVPMNGLTACLALDALGLSSGDTVGVTGAAGAVGGYVVQLARIAGLRIVADASPADEELVCRLGADVVVPRGDGFAAAVSAAVPGGVHGFVDGAVIGTALLPAVRSGGRVATLRGLDGVHERGVTFVPVMAGLHARETAVLDRLREYVEAGLLTPRVATVLPADQACEAHRLMDTGGVRGRIVLTF